MQKIYIESAGGYEKLKLVTCNDPSLIKGEVLIDVSYAGINYADCLVRIGVYASAKKYVGWPITPGFEVSGTVTAVGEGVTNFKAGDKVMAFTRFNGYSSKISIPACQVMPLPESFTLEQGACFPAVYMTAYYSMLQIFYLPPDANILVHSAAGGVGSALVSLAKDKGYKVSGVVGRSQKIQHVLDLGADHVYDKSDPKFNWAQVQKDNLLGFDAVFDANGYTTIQSSFDLLRPTGKLVIYGSHSLIPKSGGKLNYFKAIWGLLKTPKFDPMKMISENKSIICFNVSFLFEEQRLLAQNMQGLLELIKKGDLIPPKVKSFPIEQVAEAHKLIESGNSIGKLALKF